MQCTAEQIEEKKRQAQQKLAQKQGLKRPIKAFTGAFQSTSQNAPKREFKLSPSPSSSPKAFKFKPYEKSTSASSFYGKPNITASCYLISEDRFVVELKGFCSAAIDVFKMIPSKNYNPRSKMWDFSVKDHELLQEKMAVLQKEITIDILPKFVLTCCNMPKVDSSKFDLSAIDDELRETLMPFQLDAICFGIDKGGRCLLGDDMGLGKTFQALGIACYYKKDWPLLIVTTASMKNVWEETIHQYLPSVSLMHIQYMTTTKDYIAEAKILITSHDMMSRSVDKLLERNYGVLIIDESHTLKNFKTKCSKAASLLARKAKRVILLSGTPALSRPSELYTQLAMLDERFFGSFYDFSRRYCDGKQSPFGWDASGNSNPQELEIVLGKKFMIRRTKEEILESLPEKRQEIVKLDVQLRGLSEEERENLNVLSQKYCMEKSGGQKHAVLLQFFAETSRIKIPAVCSYILQIIETGQKFLVFAHHHNMLDALERLINKLNKNYIRIDGSTSSDQRKHLIDKFQLNDSYICALLSITAANAGLTLTAADLVIFAELHWNPSILSQAESRAHRIGQQKPVTVRYLIAQGTADDSIWSLLQSKQKILEEIGLAKKAFDNVNVTKHTAMHSATVLSPVKTKDIASYFVKSPVKEDVDSLFDDEFDELLGNMEF